MNTEISRIIKTIEGNIDGKPWFGNNLIQQLQGINATKAAALPEKLNHNIAEIITHMIARRQFIIEKLNGNAKYEVRETALDWVKIDSLTEINWQKLLNQLAENQTLLIETIQNKAAALLDTKVDGRLYNFRLMLNGIIQHDIYHIGQISIVKKLVI
jgi:uncharacterized damage-inducible protein DinB